MDTMSPQAQVEAQVDVFDTSSLDSAVCDEIIGKDAFMEKSLQSSAVSEDLPPYVPKLPLRIRDLSDPENEHCVSANTREPFEVDNETCHARALLKGMLSCFESCSIENLIVRIVCSFTFAGAARSWWARTAVFRWDRYIMHLVPRARTRTDSSTHKSH